MTKAKKVASSKKPSTARSTKSSSAGSTSWVVKHPLRILLIGAVLWAAAAYFAASWAIDTANMFVYALTFICIYMAANNAYKAIRAYLAKKHVNKPISKRTQA